MKKIFKNYWFSCLVILSLVSCSNDNVEELFPDSPAERIAQQNSELLNLLLAEPNGYKGVYFTKNDEFGGFTFFMKFNADGSVEMTSDFDSDSAIETSSYEVRFGTTNELVFTTRNHIQKVSNPELEGAIGTGFKGTSVFQYFGNENGVLTFRDVRNRDTGYFVFAPSNFSDFETESIASVTKSLASRDAFVNSDAVTAFPFMSIDDGSSLTEYALNYDSINLFANPTTQADDGTVSDEKFGVAFTEDGLIISPALEINGVSVEKFVLDTTSGFEYVSTTNGITAKIGYGNTPVTPLDSYSFGIRDEVAVFNMDETFKHSSAFNTFYADFSNDIANSALPGLQITNIIIWELNTVGTPYVDIRTNYGSVWFDINFDYDEETGIVKFNFTGATNSPQFFTDIIQPLLDVMFGSVKGYYTVNSGTYTTFSNRTFGLINADNPAFKTDFWTF